MFGVDFDEGQLGGEGVCVGNGGEDVGDVVARWTPGGVEVGDGVLCGGEVGGELVVGFNVDVLCHCVLGCSRCYVEGCGYCCVFVCSGGGLC